MCSKGLADNRACNISLLIFAENIRVLNGVDVESFQFAIGAVYAFGHSEIGFGHAFACLAERVKLQITAFVQPFSHLVGEFTEHRIQRGSLLLHRHILEADLLHADFEAFQAVQNVLARQSKRFAAFLKGLDHIAEDLRDLVGHVL